MSLGNDIYDGLIAAGFAVENADARAMWDEVVGPAITGYVGSVVSAWQEPVLDNSISASPGSPSTGDRYIVATGGSGAWAGHDDDVVEWNGTIWVFVTPTPGFIAWVVVNSAFSVFDGSWNPL